MRLLHTADIHLASELHGFDRAEEHRWFLDWLLEQLARRPPDALLIAGDVFHTVNPPIPAQRAYYRFLRRAADAAPGMAVIVIGGNHDSAQRLELPLELTDAPTLHVVGALPRRDGRPAPEETLIPLGPRAGGAPEIVVAAIPYPRPGDATPGEDPVKALYAAAAAAAAERWPGLPLVMMGHLHVAGGAVSELSERRILIGGQEAVSPESFPPEAAYVALGHLHRPQTISQRPLIRYAGSPFPLSASERDYRHSVTAVEIADGAVALEETPIPRPVAFLRAPAQGALPLDELEAALESLDLSAPSPVGAPYLEVAVRLETAEPDLRARIEAALGDAPVRLGRILRETAAGDGAAPEPETALIDLSPETVFARLHDTKYGAPPPPALEAAFHELLASSADAADASEAG